MGLSFVEGTPARITGTPTTLGRMQFLLTAKDSDNNTVSSSVLVFLGEDVPHLQEPIEPQFARVGDSFTYRLPTTAFTDFEDSDSSLFVNVFPSTQAGLSINPGLQTSGLRLSGTPTAAGDFEFVLTVRDSSGNIGRAVISVTIVDIADDTQLIRRTLTLAGSLDTQASLVGSDGVEAYRANIQAELVRLLDVPEDRIVVRPLEDLGGNIGVIVDILPRGADSFDTTALSAVEISARLDALLADEAAVASSVVVSGLGDSNETRMCDRIQGRFECDPQSKRNTFDYEHILIASGLLLVLCCPLLICCCVRHSKSTQREKVDKHAANTSADGAAEPREPSGHRDDTNMSDRGREDPDERDRRDRDLNASGRYSDRGSERGDTSYRRGRRYDDATPVSPLPREGAAGGRALRCVNVLLCFSVHA